MTIPFLRDVSVVLLALEAFVIGLVPLAVLYVAAKALHQVPQSIRPVLRQLRAQVEQVQTITHQVSELIVAPIIAMYCLVTRVRSFIMAVIGLLPGGIAK